MDASGSKSLSMEELISGIWRRRKLVLLVTLVALGLGALYLVVTPRSYVASVVVRVGAQQLPEQYVSPTVTELVETRLSTVRHELLARPVIARVIEELDLFPELRAEDGIGAAVEAVRRNLEVKVEGENAYLLSYEATDPVLAARVANRLPELYAQEALDERAAAAARASQIFDAELTSMRPQVEALESKLTAFKASNAGRLPETLESNLRQMDRLSGLLEATVVSLADAQRRRTGLARLGAENNVEVARFAAMMNDARRELASLRSIYTDGHPEVLSAAREYQSAKARYERAANESAQGDSEAARIDSELEFLKGTAVAYQKRLESFMARVDATPAKGAELSALNRDYEAVRAKYQTLLSRKVEAELAQDLERRQKASLFRVIEPAFAPSKPAEPHPSSAMGIALLLGLGAGIALAVYLSMRDTSIRGVADARLRLGLPVLAAVPMLPPGRGQRHGS